MASIVFLLPRAALETVTLYFDAALASSPAGRGVRVFDTILAQFPVLRELAVRVPRHPQKSQSELDRIRAAWPLAARRASVTVTTE